MNKETTKIEPFISESSIEEIRLKKCQELRKKNINPFPHNFDKKHNISNINQQFKNLSHGDECIESIQTAGRLMAKRGHGKASFCNIMDDSGSIQIYAKLDILGEAEFNHFMDLDIGDIIGIKGTPFVTKRGELSIKLSSVILLTKSL